VIHFDLHGANGLPSLFHSTPNFGEEVDRRRLCFSKDIYMVRGHALLSNENFFRTIDYEVTTLYGFVSKQHTQAILVEH